MVKPLPTAKNFSAPKVARSAIKCANKMVGNLGFNWRTSPSRAGSNFSIKTRLISSMDKPSVSGRVKSVERLSQGKVII